MTRHSTFDKSVSTVQNSIILLPYFPASAERKEIETERKCRKLN